MSPPHNHSLPLPCPPSILPLWPCPTPSGLALPPQASPSRRPPPSGLALPAPSPLRPCPPGALPPQAIALPRGGQCPSGPMAIVVHYEYVTLVWEIVSATPLWDNPVHNTTRVTCFKNMASSVIRVLKHKEIIINDDMKMKLVRLMIGSPIREVQMCKEKLLECRM